MWPKLYYDLFVYNEFFKGRGRQIEGHLETLKDSDIGGWHNGFGTLYDCKSMKTVFLNHDSWIKIGGEGYF